MAKKVSVADLKSAQKKLASKTVANFELNTTRGFNSGKTFDECIIIDVVPTSYGSKIYFQHEEEISNCNVTQEMELPVAGEICSLTISQSKSGSQYLNKYMAS